MMKNLYLLALTCILLQLPAQQKNLQSPPATPREKAFIGIFAGRSFPVGNFGSLDPGNKEAGLAKAGFVMDLSITYKITDNFGPSAMMLAQVNPFDDESIGADLTKSLPGVLITTESTSWRLTGGMFGGYATFEGSNKVDFDVRAMAGILSATSPLLKIQARDGAKLVWSEQRETGASAFSYLVSAGVRYSVATNVRIFGICEYLSCKPSFKNVPVFFSDGTVGIFDLEQSMTTANIKAGIAVMF